jgi:galactosylceramidase
MHDPWTVDYKRGYEWSIMQEAKNRNPNVYLYGLPWAFPAWVSCNPGTLQNCSTNNDPYVYPQQTATYITNWVIGAKTVYGYDVDYIGSWLVLFFLLSHSLFLSMPYYDQLIFSPFQ